MPGTLLFPLWAVHISDGILTWPWLVGGFILAGCLALLGVWRMRDEEIPQVALLAAAFFVASLVHVSLGPSTSVHLLLNGLVGVVLGRRAGLAIGLGLFLQAALLGHGGFTSVGVNTCVMALPALGAWQVFAVLRRVPWRRHRWFRAGLVVVSTSGLVLSLVYGLALLSSRATGGAEWARSITFHPLTLTLVAVLAVLAAYAEHRVENAPEFSVGLLLGGGTVLATALLACLVLAWGAQDRESWDKLVQVLFVAHIPIALVEGVVLGFTLGFLARVKPEMLGGAWVEEKACPAESVV